MHPDVPYFSILLCLTPDDFTCQVESAATQWDTQHNNNKRDYKRCLWTVHILL